MADFPRDIAALQTWLQTKDIEYYDKDAPSVPDSVYDAAVAFWKEATGKPWEVLGSASKEFKRVKHIEPMLSLEKVTSVEELLAWVPAENDYVLTPKIDGMACRLVYKNGKLVEALSRGNGTVGESIIHSLQPIIGSHIPASLGDAPPHFYVTGEVYLPTDLFARVGGANPRNAAAGLVRRKAPTAHQQHLRFIAYNILDNQWKTKYQEHLEWLELRGFQCPPHQVISSKEFSSYSLETLSPKHWHDKELEYETDGVVLAANELHVRESLGATNHHPRWACAVKFEVKTAVSTLIAVEWNAGRTGVIVPTAIFQAVNLCGTVVTRATMHNFEHYQKMGIRVGDQIVIAKQGDIIPAVKGKYLT